MNTETIDGRPGTSGGYKVDVSRGDNVDRVSSEWFSRPDDERYLSLDDLFASVKGRAERSRTRTVESAAIRVEAHRDDPEKLGLVLPGADEPIAPTHWSFGQLSSLVGAPAAYLRQLPAPLAGINLQYGLTNHRAEQIKTMEVANGRTELRAVTGPDYGRIYDHELVSAVKRIAGNGTGDTRWKVPGVLDWSTGIYNPRVDVTKETTTLYASDRDVFLFLVDDLNPIEAGLLPDGSPDLYFRGFYCWNSEVGAKTLGIASFYLRAVCQNRNLWGVEDFQEITIRHSKYAASRFAHEAAPALSRFAESSPAPFIDGIRAAREKIVARSDEDRQDFLRKRGFSKAETGRIVETVLAEEGRPPESVFDFVQGITAVARSKPQQDARLVMEGKGRRARPSQRAGGPQAARPGNGRAPTIFRRAPAGRFASRGKIAGLGHQGPRERLGLPGRSACGRVPATKAACGARPPRGRNPQMTLDPETDAHEPHHSTSSTAHVLTELQLYGWRPYEDEPDPRPLPEGSQIAEAVADILDALVATLGDTRLEPELDELLWGAVNLFHRALARAERQLDDNEQAQRRLQREQDGSEVKSLELERLLAEGQSMVERRTALELFRDLAAEGFEHHLGRPWHPRTGSRVSHRNLTAAMIDSRDFLAARRRAEAQLLLPEGPKVAVTGGSDFNDHRLIWARLDRVHAKHPDMVLLHGGSPKG